MLYRKTLILFFVCCNWFMVKGQSPYLAVRVEMDSTEQHTDYSIEMRVCTPVNAIKTSDWFTPDTSTINFSEIGKDALQYDAFKSTDDFYRNKSGGKLYNRFRYGNQVFAWEKILVFRITNHSSRGLQPPMFIVLPMIYKSFISTVTLTNIIYQSGHIVFLDKPAAYYKDDRLYIKQSIPLYSGKRYRELPIWQWLGDEY
ncbi:MAG TPA: hypothetical protein P5158_02075 [Chitinophagaceae bacterium]|nr:hypothetical protein [Chitinophagaceae bacterium]MCB9055766.1 hypothetical protein [Chitinophagales bacterium]HRX92868.1 hypothetical protein [Chitinophagaceae bacterium]